MLVQIPGKGNSSPVIFGDRLFIMSAEASSAKRFLICLNSKTGKQNWVKEYDSKVHRLHSRNTFASCTPAVDKSNVYFAWSDPDRTIVIALDHKGNEVWKKNLGPWLSSHGFGTSPIIYKDKLILSNSQKGDKLKPGQKPGISTMVAFNRKTGDVIWSTPRRSLAASYCVPCIYRGADGKDQLICSSTADGMYSLDPETGKQNWSIDVFKMRTVASPTIAGDLILGSTGSGGGGNYVVAIRPPSDGNKAKVEFKVTKNANYVPCPIVHDGRIFIWYDKGIISCVDAKDGTNIWRSRIDSEISGSPILVQDRMYCIADDGNLYIVKASNKFELIAKIDLGERSRATPAVANGQLYLRTDSHIISVGG